jgi:hypothetical protein
MNVALQSITIRDVVAGYVDSAEEGVVGYGGRLDIRPKYQREFVYREQQREAVVDTIRRNFPLNVMYWVVNGDNQYEVLDGQQRTISFCQYVKGDFSVLVDDRPMAFHNLTNAEQERILDYPLMVYFCEGDEKEKLDWFKIVNIAGERLLPQELRNAVYTGPWLSHAKVIFSKTGCPAYMVGSKYVSGSPIRQQFLETALTWLSKGEIQEYMSRHQHDPNANELWTYFQAVIAWVEATFTTYRSEMKGQKWGELYNQFKDTLYDTAKLESEIKALLMDDDVTKRAGIYPYVLTREEKHLNLRSFTPADKRAAYERQGGVCPRCGKQFEISEMQADHITPWSKGGKTLSANCQMLCADDNRRKSNT